MILKNFIFLILLFYPAYVCSRRVHVTYWPRNTTAYTGRTGPFLKLTMEYLMEQKKIVPNVFPAGPRDTMFVSIKCIPKTTFYTCKSSVTTFVTFLPCN